MISVTLNATWNGIQNEGPPTQPTGVFVVHNALIPNGPTAEFTVVDKYDCLLTTQVRTLAGEEREKRDFKVLRRAMPSSQECAPPVAPHEPVGK